MVHAPFLRVLANRQSVGCYRWNSLVAETSLFFALGRHREITEDDEWIKAEERKIQGCLRSASRVSVVVVILAQ
jgi:hypothetical protein